MLNKFNLPRRFWILPVYSIFYMIFFNYLEARTNVPVHIISTPIDKYIPFCEYFVIPYYMWFFYVMAAVAYFIFFSRDAREYYRLEIVMITGMSVFLFVSFIYPNGLELRPTTFPRENFCTDIVRYLYRTDTPTNVFPSIHVFNSLAICTAIHRCKKLKDKMWVQIPSTILAVLIILSTMFLKQHSTADVICAAILYVVLYRIVYQPQTQNEHQKALADS